MIRVYRCTVGSEFAATDEIDAHAEHVLSPIQQFEAVCIHAWRPRKCRGGSSDVCKALHPSIARRNFQNGLAIAGMTIAALPSQFFSLQLQLFLPARQPATLALQRQSREVLGMGMGKEMAIAQGMAVKHRSRQALDRAVTLTERSILAQAKPLA